MSSQCRFNGVLSWSRSPSNKVNDMDGNVLYLFRRKDFLSIQQAKTLGNVCFPSRLTTKKEEIGISLLRRAKEFSIWGIPSINKRILESESAKLKTPPYALDFSLFARDYAAMVNFHSHFDAPVTSRTILLTAELLYACHVHCSLAYADSQINGTLKYATTVLEETSRILYLSSKNELDSYKKRYCSTETERGIHTFHEFNPERMNRVLDSNNLYGVPVDHEEVCLWRVRRHLIGKHTVDQFQLPGLDKATMVRRRNTSSCLGLNYVPHNIDIDVSLRGGNPSLWLLAMAGDFDISSIRFFPRSKLLRGKPIFMNKDFWHKCCSYTHKYLFILNQIENYNSTIRVSMVEKTACYFFHAFVFHGFRFEPPYCIWRKLRYAPKESIYDYGNDCLMYCRSLLRQDGTSRNYFRSCLRSGKGDMVLLVEDTRLNEMIPFSLLTRNKNMFLSYEVLRNKHCFY